tara:strand:- start:159 stop:584 length:426 start_codon:yes stop_codon:yes gene_type:complete
MTSQSDMFYELLNKMRIVHDNKRHDYASKEDIFKNFRTSELAGIPAWQGVAIRIGDKFSRLMSFVKQKELKVADESIGDTLIDMANYALICHILFYEMRRKQQDEYKDKVTEDFLNKRQYKYHKEHGDDITYENESIKNDT